MGVGWGGGAEPTKQKNWFWIDQIGILNRGKELKGEKAKILTHSKDIKIPYGI
jgi:hypothetical protein